MKIPPSDEISWKRLRGILITFLEGKKNINWVIGSFKNISESKFDSILSEALNLARIHPQRQIEIFQIRERLYGNSTKK